MTAPASSTAPRSWATTVTKALNAEVGGVQVGKFLGVCSDSKLFEKSDEAPKWNSPSQHSTPQKAKPLSWVLLGWAFGAMLDGFSPFWVGVVVGSPFISQQPAPARAARNLASGMLRLVEPLGEMMGGVAGVMDVRTAFHRGTDPNCPGNDTGQAVADVFASFYLDDDAAAKYEIGHSISELAIPYLINFAWKGGWQCLAPNKDKDVPDSGNSSASS